MTKEYYYVNSAGEQTGPLDINAIRQLHLDQSTLVWCEGMTQWVAASQINELAGYLKVTPPPQSVYATTPQSAPQPAPTQNPQNVCPPTYMSLAIITTLLCCLPLGIVGIINANKVSTLWLSGDYIGAQKSSDAAKNYCIIGMAISAVVYFFIILFGIMFG